MAAQLQAPGAGTTVASNVKDLEEVYFIVGMLRSQPYHAICLVFSEKETVEAIKRVWAGTPFPDALIPSKKLREELCWGTDFNLHLAFPRPSSFQEWIQSILTRLGKQVPCGRRTEVPIHLVFSEGLW